MSFDICSAIKNREVIQFYYEGGIRIVEPFCYGESTKGNLVLRGYQVDGYSSSGNPIGWKLFIVDNMHNISLTGRKFSGLRPDYNPNDRGMVRIICNV
ncbi:hypothetical protein [Thermoanaerobacter wiegelii]|uniref:WYL domain-containing protein n=1 Tax=Thermoanaerobacter wiegelii Rt8.B1 TaxID=697303 RepID=G2MV61_9THEO|nr:hypothetical protein [Thermoanaerobacter wiegelii]AEM78240.1 hypothetical protein Thewi_0803 [Thermoanaerobacter wiegelii Rt8.B1]